FKLSRLHCLKLHPFDRLGTKILWSPLVGAVKDSQLVRHANGIQRPSESHHLGIVEVSVANCGEHNEWGRTRREDVCRKSRPASYDAGKLPCRRISKLAAGAGVSGKRRGIDAGIIYIKSGVRILPHGIDGG